MLPPDQLNHRKYHPVTEELVDWKKLDPPRQKALAAILDGKGVNGAAKDADVHRGTVYRWMRSDPHFRKTLATFHQLTQSASRETLHSMIELAAINVRNAIRFGDLRASLALLRATGTLAEVDSDKPSAEPPRPASAPDQETPSPTPVPPLEIPPATQNQLPPRATVARLVARRMEYN